MRFSALGLALYPLLTTVVPASAIVGSARESQNASVVTVLGRAGSRAGFCSGVVIARNAVLTAAHCAHAPADTRVHYRDAQGAPVLLDVARVVRHAGYRSNAVAERARSVDLALVFTRDDLPSRFSPAALGSASSDVGAPFTVAGYGVAHEGDGRSAGVLRSADVTLRAPVSSLLLWLVGAGGACTGDSGGPVFDRAGAVVGIVAFAQGAGANQCGALTQAVRVAPFQAWIDATIGR